MNNWFKSRKPTLAMAKRMIKKANPNVKNLKVTWETKPKFFEGKTKGYFYWGAFVNVAADGFKPKRMSINVDNDSKSIR